MREKLREMVERAMDTENAAVEAFCRALVKEKGSDSVLDYELVREQTPDGFRWYFRHKGGGRADPIMKVKGIEQGRQR